MDDKQKHQSKNIFTFVLLIFILAGFLRIYNLGKLSLWADEPIHLYVAESLQKDGSFALPSGDVYERAKLFAYSTMISTKIFGLNELGVRIPSAIFGVLALILFFFFTRRILGTTIAILTILLLSVLPFEIGWARVSRFYTLFQIFTILVWYTFYISFFTKNSFLYKMITRLKFKNLIRNWEINWFYMFLFIFFLLIATSVQIISVLLLLPIFLFIIIYSIYVFFRADINTFLVSKYFVFSSVAIIVFMVSYLIVPQIGEMIKYGISFIPDSSKNPSAQDRMIYIKYIFGKDIFPLGAFFVIGTVQALIRLNKVVIYSALFFIVQIFLFTFIFSYRENQYIYNVFPFFILVASYGIINIVKQEKERFQKGKNFIYQFFSKYMRHPSKFVYIIFSLLLILTPFFIEGISIPFNKPGDSNGAVTFLEWKEAAEYLKKKNVDSEVILTTLPLAVKYYLGKVDYNLNMAEMEVAEKYSSIKDGNRLYDFYSGAYFIETASQLDSLVRNSPGGFIIADTFRLINHQYISKEVAQYIDKNLKLEYITPFQTVRVYGWNHVSNENEKLEQAHQRDLEATL